MRSFIDSLLAEYWYSGRQRGCGCYVNNELERAIKVDDHVITETDETAVATVTRLFRIDHYRCYECGDIFKHGRWLIEETVEWYDG